MSGDVCIGALSAFSELLYAFQVQPSAAAHGASRRTLSTMRNLYGTDMARREEREQRRNDIEHLATSLVGKVNECVAALDEERTTRVQEQSISLKRFGEDLLTMQQVGAALVDRCGAHVHGFASVMLWSLVCCDYDPCVHVSGLCVQFRGACELLRGIDHWEGT